MHLNVVRLCIRYVNLLGNLRIAAGTRILRVGFFPIAKVQVIYYCEFRNKGTSTKRKGVFESEMKEAEVLF